MRSTEPKKFFSSDEEKLIIDSIKKAEKQTSGEIRLHLEKKVTGDIFKFAVKKFDKLEMYKTKDKNGCLIVLDLTNKKFAIIGDKGIYEKSGKNFWNAAADILKKHFAENKFAEGLSLAICEIGIKLKTNFPYQSDDINELSDEISKG